MPRCLITGASGFVGSNLAQIFTARGWDVRCLVRKTSRTDRLAQMDVELALGSLDDDASLRSATSDAELVVHVAGRVTALSAGQFDRDNVEGTRSVAQACATQANPPTLVYVSSLAAGGPGTPDDPRKEKDAPHPVSAYGRSKLAAELAAAEFAGQIPLSIVRPPIVFGQGDRASLSMYRGMRFLPIHPTPGMRRFPVSLIHVADLADALERIATGGARVVGASDGSPRDPQGLYYVAAERDVTYGELGRLAARAAGWRIAVVPTPLAVFWFAAAIGEAAGRARGRPMLINFDKIREAMAPGWICSGAKLRDELGFRTAHPLEDRFDETVSWYREQGWL